MQQQYDLVIVGAGLAGLTAGMTAARFGLRTVIVDHGAAGGQILNVEKIENFPGFPTPQGVAGFDLGPLVQEQAEQAGAEFAFDTVTGLEAHDGQKIVHCAGTDLTSGAVIVAAGSTFRTLGIPGEEQYLGKGVSHCASCDAPFFVDKEVIVVGGGDSALDEAAVLADQVARVYIVHRGTGFSAQEAAQQRLAEKSNIETLLETELVAILGQDTVSGVRLRGDGATREQPIAGVFIFVGLEPNTAFLRGLVDLDSSGHIVTDIALRTSVRGVFAAGDIRQGSVAQLAAVVGDGATAAVTAFRYLRGL
jgi:thioredoxin reductase (NADPH)